jgi:hypothetical protein
MKKISTSKKQHLIQRRDKPNDLGEEKRTGLEKNV